MSILLLYKKYLLIGFLLGFIVLPLASQNNKTLADNPNPPSNPVKLVFIHHSTGGNWLSDGWGGLGLALMQNNYYVSDVCYGWGRNSIGDRTDLGNWWEWFRDTENSPGYLEDLYSIDQIDGNYGEYSRLTENPGGENAIIMFKSCFPNSQIYGDPNDPIPSIENNPMKGESAGSETYTIANAKGIYLDLLEYFKTKPDKLFIIITAPPLIDETYAGNARALNQWLVHNLLNGYPLQNVFVFDFYNCLTTNGGNINTNDLNSQNGNHHRWWNGAVQHTYDGSSNTLAYQSEGGDEHPNPVGNEKTTAEYVPLLNVAYNRWISSLTNVEDNSAKINSRVFNITPNPVVDKCLISYQLPDKSNLKIEVLNTIGKVVDIINIDAAANSGTYFYNTSTLTNGEYFLKLNTIKGINIVPMIVIK